MTNTKGRLILNVEHDQLLPFAKGNLMVAFYDVIKPAIFNKKIETRKASVDLYIYVSIVGDKSTIVRKKAGTKKLVDKYGTVTHIPEIEFYDKAYKKYLDLKNQPIAKTAEVIALEKELKELKELKADKETKETKTEKTVSDLKSELSTLGVVYKGNASRATLEELLYKNKEVNNDSIGNSTSDPQGD